MKIKYLLKKKCLYRMDGTWSHTHHTFIPENVSEFHRDCQLIVVIAQDESFGDENL